MAMDSILQILHMIHVVHAKLVVHAKDISFLGILLPKLVQLCVVMGSSNWFKNVMMVI